MPLISHRECHLVTLKNEELNKFVEEIDNFLKEKGIPEDYTIKVFKDAVGCCGYMPIGVTVEIDGPENQPIKNLDMMIYSKIIEICERENIEYHECKPMEVINSR